MESVVRMAFVDSLLIHATIEALLTKGILSKTDIQNALTTITYESAAPAEITADARSIVTGLSGDS